MWIWYLLLGSGSGSRSVGKFFKLNVVITARTRFGAGSEEEGALIEILKDGLCGALLSPSSFLKVSETTSLKITYKTFLFPRLNWTLCVRTRL